MASADVGIIGGSGFYALGSDDVEWIKLDTPYGPPSDRIALTHLNGIRVAFLPRHGTLHSIPPHKINFRANLWAMHAIGVSTIIAPSAVGSLQKHIHPGDFVVNDQFVDRTSGRMDTFYDGPIATHVSTADPYCPVLRQLAIDAARENSIRVHGTGTAVVIQGPRFSSKAESAWFSREGWDVVTMTQYPEVALARELAMCYVNISLVTDYDAGTLTDSEPVQTSQILEILKQNTENTKRLINTLLKSLPETKNCSCNQALVHARLD